MVYAISEDLDAQERDVILRGLYKINAFMRLQVETYAAGKEE